MLRAQAWNFVLNMAHGETLILHFDSEYNIACVSNTFYVGDLTRGGIGSVHSATPHITIDVKHITKSAERGRHKSLRAVSPRRLGKIHTKKIQAFIKADSQGNGIGDAYVRQAAIDLDQCLAENRLGVLRIVAILNRVEDETERRPTGLVLLLASVGGRDGWNA